MALATGMPASSARNPSPTALNLSSNNPFRNRTSPLPSPSALEAPKPDNRNSRMSRNPFLDSNAVSSSSRNVSQNDAVNGLTADIFGDMSLLDKTTSNGPSGPPPYSRPPRSGTMPGPQNLPNGQSSPVRRDVKPTHYRRNSESSVMDKDRATRRERDRSERPPRTESEERRRCERRKEREERHRREKERVRSGRSQRGLDIIDKLDVTGVYGQGVFHHDGPFDACNPHRNIKKDKRAPIRAFPADSANMALGGNGPLRSRLDLDRFHGRGEEGFSDYATARKADMAVFNPTDRVEQVHGRETSGLGTSTFLDGAPASKSALQRRTSDEQNTQEPSAGGGLQRKKSLAQRLRGMSSGRRERPTDLRSPEGRYLISSNNNSNSSYAANSSAILDSPPAPKALSPSGPARAKYTRENEINPFDTEYNDAFDKKGTQIRIIAADDPKSSAGEAASSSTTLQESSANFGRARAPSNPPARREHNPLTRSKTEDSSASSALRVRQDEEKAPSGGGLLSRMKSLRGGRRQRPERRESDY